MVKTPGDMIPDSGTIALQPFEDSMVEAGSERLRYTVNTKKLMWLGHIAMSLQKFTMH